MPELDIDVRIRERHPDDVPAAVELLRETHEHDGYPEFWPSDPAGFLVPRREQRAWAATVEGRVVGHVSLCAAQGDPVLPAAAAATGLPADRLVVVSRLAVALSQRGTGLGRQLVRVAVDATRADGLLAVLDVNKRVTASVEFYERLGWRRIGELTMSHEGRTLDLWAFVAPDDDWPDRADSIVDAV